MKNKHCQPKEKIIKVVTTSKLSKLSLEKLNLVSGGCLGGAFDTELTI